MIKDDLNAIKFLLKKNKNQLKDQFHVAKIGIFGSRAGEDNSILSDLDILIELEQPVGWEIVDLHHYLEKLLDLKVDLVTKGAVIRKPALWQSIQEDIIYV